MANRGAASITRDIPKLETLFKPGSWMSKIDFINHLVLFNNIMMAILAEQGGGKTSFVKLLRTHLNAEIKSHAVTALAPFRKEELFAHIADAFHLRIDKAPCLDSLIEQVTERKTHVLVIIDDAQHIPGSFLKEVLEVIKNQGNSGFFHLCLVADYSLVADLNELNRDQFKNLIHTIEPGALSESEVKTYLLNRLPSTGRLEKSLTPKRLKQFYELTGGDIARINHAMASFFGSGANDKDKKNKSFIRRFSIAASVALTGLTAGYFWQNQEQFRDMLFPSFQEVSPSPAATNNLNNKITVKKDKILVSRIPTLYQAAVRQAVQPPPLKKMFDIQPDEDDQDLVIMDKVLVIPKEIAKRTAEPEPVLHSSLIALDWQEMRESAPSVLPRLVTTASKPHSRYTIQLLASQSYTDIERFINKHPRMKEQVVLKKSKRGGLEWFVLTTGEYSQFEQAKAAIKQLPPEAMRYKPWIRPVSGLREVS
ncbi:AAA family ATPase [Legionella spiritensis]|uniref:DamX-related protein n=1 Tax=Legionella spiritensis TaxID=452 RepID=A0A0W0Z7F1_LEGSP|nr:AAA family ATPase [Legionella spiritensis]KTD64878.1 DamX-related protein [Legionella spiritensis]SNV41065.1 DamX-like protein [Legionella spiritensis]